MTRVKVCGLMNIDDICICAQAGVHALGFVVDFPVPVPWNLTRAEAARLVSRVPPFVGTCAVTGGKPDIVIETAEAVCPDIVQLHYGETLGEVREIALALKPKGIKTIKALRINSNGRCDFEIEDPQLAARALSESGVSALLVDSHTETMPGGTGIEVGTDIYLKIKNNSSLPVILAGGLNSSNIGRVIGEAKPFAVDILTGVERAPGCKDAGKLRAFMDIVQNMEKNQ